MLSKQKYSGWHSFIDQSSGHSMFQGTVNKASHSGKHMFYNNTRRQVVYFPLDAVHSRRKPSSQAEINK